MAKRKKKKVSVKRKLEKQLGRKLDPRSVVREGELIEPSGRRTKIKDPRSVVRRNEKKRGR